MDTELGRPDEEPPGIRRVRAILKWNGEHDFAAGCPLWSALSIHASRREEIAAVPLDAPSGQQRGSLLLSAVHDLVLRGTDHPLRQYFPNIVEAPRPVDSAVAASFDDFVASWTLAYLSVDERRQFLEALHRAGRPVGLVCLEGPDIIPGVDASHLTLASTLSLVISTITFDRGHRHDRVLGSISGQGDWIRLTS